MPLIVADRVKETTATTGTGTVNLGGAASGFIGFVAGIGNGNTCYYSIVGATEWEVGIGTVTDAATDTLSRTTVLSSSNANALVNFSAGTKDVFVTIPASFFLTAATAGSILFAGAAGVPQQDNANLFWDDTNNRLGLGRSDPAYVLDIKKVGHTDTFSGPGDLVYRMVDNDSSGGRDSNLNLYHQYFPSQGIDIYSFLNTNGFAGGVNFSLGFGSLYASNFLFIKGGGISFDNITTYFNQQGTNRLAVALNGANGSFNITRPGGDDTNLQFTPSSGLRIQAYYESRTLLQTSQALGGTILTPLTETDRPLIVRGYAGQTADLTQWQNSALAVLAKVAFDGVIFPLQAVTASAPVYVLGGMYFDTTLNKLRIGGASGWETVQSI